MAVITGPAFNDVFISYSRRDSNFVHQLVDALERDGHDVWVDWEDIEYAEDWWDRICGGIESADNFIFILTPNSVRSSVCYDEVDYAVHNGKRIIPVLHQPLEDEDDFRQMHPAISQHNWLPFREDDVFDDVYRTFLDTIHADPQHVKTHTRLLAKAREWEQSGQQRDRLLAGQALEEAIVWQTQAINKNPELTELQAEFIAQSQERRRQSNQFRFAAITVIMVGALLMALVAVAQRNEATIALVTAEAASTLASSARSTAEFNATEAFVAQGIAERNSDEASSLVLAASAREEADRGNWELELPLLLEANRNLLAPDLVQRRLADAVYRPGVTANLTANESLRSVPEAFGVAPQRFQPYMLVVYVIENQVERAKTQIIHIPSGEAVSVDIEFETTVDVLEPVYAVGPEQSALMVAPNEVVLIDNATGIIAQHVNLPFDAGQVVRRMSIDTNNQRLTIFAANPAPGSIAAASGSAFATGTVLDVTMADGSIAEVANFGDVSVGEAVLRPDGDMLLLFAADRNKYSLWTREAGLQSAPIPLNPGERMLNVALSPNGQRLAVNVQVETDISLTELRVYDFQQRRVFRVEGHSATLVRLDFTSDSQTLLAAYTDGVVILQPLNSTNLTSRREVNFNMSVIDLQFGPFGNQGYVLHGNNVYRLAFNSDVPLNAVRVGNNVAEPTLNLEQSMIFYALNPVGEQSSVQSQSLVEADAITREVATLVTSDVRIEHLAVAPAGNELLYSTRLRLVLVDLTTENYYARQIREFPFGMNELVSMSYSPTGQHILFLTESGDLYVIQRETLNNASIERDDFFITPDVDTTTKPVFSSDGLSIAFIDRQDAPKVFVQVWAFQTNNFRDIFLGDALQPTRITFSPDASQLLLATEPELGGIAFVQVLDAVTGQIRRTLSGHRSAVSALTFSPDGESALTASADVIVWWNLVNGEILRRFDGDGEQVEQVAITEDRNLFWVGESGLLSSWKSETRSQIIDFACNSRYVETLDKNERSNFGIMRLSNLCAEQPGQSVGLPQ